MVGGSRWIPAALGFVEITVWALALGGMVKYLDHPIALIGYASGFAAGTVVGQPRRSLQDAPVRRRAGSVAAD